MILAVTVVICKFLDGRHSLFPVIYFISNQKYCNSGELS